MLELLATAASALAAIAAVMGAVIGLRRTARLRRSEQQFREILAAMPNEDPRRKIVTELHRKMVAGLVSRQLTPAWRLMAPWVVWLVLAASFAQVGYLTADFLHEDATGRSFWDYLIQVTGDPISSILLVPVVLLFVPQFYMSFRTILMGRAETALNFYKGLDVARSPTFIDRARTPASEQANVPTKRIVTDWLRSLVPGFVAISLGNFIGMQIWVTRQPGPNLESLQILGSYYAGSLFGFSFAIASAFMLIGSLNIELKRFELPFVHEPHRSSEGATNIASTNDGATGWPNEGRETD